MTQIERDSLFRFANQTVLLIEHGWFVITNEGGGIGGNKSASVDCSRAFECGRRKKADVNHTPADAVRVSPHFSSVPRSIRKKPRTCSRIYSIHARSFVSRFSHRTRPIKRAARRENDAQLAGRRKSGRVRDRIHHFSTYIHMHTALYNAHVSLFLMPIILSNVLSSARTMASRSFLTRHTLFLMLRILLQRREAGSERARIYRHEFTTRCLSRIIVHHLSYCVQITFDTFTTSLLKRSCIIFAYPSKKKRNQALQLPRRCRCSRKAPARSKQCGPRFK